MANDPSTDRTGDDGPARRDRVAAPRPAPAPSAAVPPDPVAPDLIPADLVHRVGELARETLEVGVGLGVLGLLTYRSERPKWEAQLERFGLTPAAELSRWTGGFIDRGVLRLLGQ